MQRIDQESLGDADNPLSIILPCKPEDFGEFLSSLLGDSQVIEDELFGGYVVERADIFNFFQLVEHRVKEQDQGGLVSMTLTITYDDKSSVKFSSFNDFNSYAEIKSHVSTGFNLNLAYLIKFNGRTIPEKQEIDISFVDMHLLYTYDNRPARFKIRISHTARSWGVAIESLLIGYINTIRRVPTSRFRKIIGEWNVLIGFFTAFFVFATSSFGLIWQLHRLGAQKSVEVFTRLSSLPTNLKQDEVNRLILKEIYQGSQDAKTLTFFCFVLFFVAFSISIGAAAGDFLSLKDRGYFTFTREAINLYDERVRAHKFFWTTLAIGSILSITTGIISNILFALISNL